jgi:iron complex outermembrane receptor protein
VTLATVTVSAGGASICQEPPVDLTAIGLEAVMDMEVTSVSKRPEKLMGATAAVHVITSEEIRRSGANSVPELLRLVPGVQVARIDSNKWAIGVRGFASRLSRSLLVLIDGRSVYSPLFAGVYWEAQDTLMDDIDRIEVIRGPGATLWGANAVNGVVNIITKSARHTQGSMVKVGGGDEERGLAAYRFGGTTSGGVSFRTYAKFFDRGAGFHQSTADFDGWSMAQAGFRADADLDAQDSLTIQGDLYDGSSGQRTTITTYSSPYTQTLEEDADLSGANVLGRWKHLFHGGSGATLQFYVDRAHRREPSFEEDRGTFDLEFQHHLSLRSRHDLVWGAGYRVSSGDTEAVPTIQFLPEDRTDSTFSAFVQDEIRLIPSRLWLTIGSKFEHNDYSGFEYQPNLRVLVTPSSKQTVWSAISRALRVPSRVEHDLVLTAFMEPTTPTFIRVLGTRDFEAERLTAYEIGYRLQAAERLFLDVTAFHDDYSRLLSLEPGTPFTETSPPPDHTVVPLFIQNKMGAEVRGVEVAWDWQPVPAWRLSGSYSYLNMDLVKAADSLDASTEASTEGSSPRGAAGLRSSLDLPRNFGVDVMIRYVGSLPSQQVEAYTELDLAFRWRPAPSLELILVGRNLKSSRHVEFAGGGSGRTEVERSVYGSLVRRW